MYTTFFHFSTNILACKIFVTFIFQKRILTWATVLESQTSIRIDLFVSTLTIMLATATVVYDTAVHVSVCLPLLFHHGIIF